MLSADSASLANDPDRAFTAPPRGNAALDATPRGDALTGLRSLPQIGVWLARRVDAGSATVVAAVNLDGFSEVNNVHGLVAGDHVLRTLADRLLAVLPPGAVAARVSADEYLLGVPAESADDAEALAQSVLQVLARPIAWRDRSIRMSASLGIAEHTPRHGERAGALIERALSAMRAAKAQHGDSFRVYSGSRAGAPHDWLDMRVGLDEALERGELDLAYQPKQSLRDGGFTGLEALLRWEHRDMGPVSPEQCIPVAEATGQIHAVGGWVLDAAARAAADWRRRFPLHVAINVSVRQLASEAFVRRVADALGRHGLPGEALHLEITETVMMVEPEAVARILRPLRALGVQVALDDFGAGYSSLGCLREIAPDYLKLDRSLVQGLAASRRQRIILRSVVDLAAGLGIRVVGEGVEDRADLEALCEAGCHEAQGFLVAPPVAEAGLAGLLEGVSLSA